ncbi:aldolase [Streptomyces viridiviolaceus]|uniref:HpcH/HpaI aldolase/citrate lyase family protein n=1 Tax=Streptomyces viridiviolaceus TaxID=68282 RepID=A0ABW2E7X4_9ACTN|nr:aldolase/citrate lyase family protein [Streptomyces viridiviolaceus]GHB67627.1 aldolase [Streptomyces viridiviolaceus]
MHLRENRLKKILERGATALGCSFNEARDAGMVYAMAAAGADSVFIDLEHNPHNLETVSDLIAHAHAAGITPIVRPPQVDYAWITRLLDCGCQSLLIPRLRRPAEVEQLLELSLYHPRGRRGVAVVGGAGVNYQEVTDVPAATAWANDQMLLALVVETPEAVENLDGMLMPGIGLVVMGYQDLAQGYGVLGNRDHPLIADAEAEVRTRCLERGIAFGTFQPDLEKISEEVSKGAQLIVHGGVFAFIRRGVREAAAVVHGGPSE